MALLHWPAAALLFSPGLGLGDGPGVADRLGDSGALLGSDSVVGGLAVRGSGNPLGNSNRSSSNSNTMLLLDHINHIVALRLLSRGADLLGHWPGDSMALLHWPAAALLLSPGLGLGDGPGVADRLGDSGALLGSDS